MLTELFAYYDSCKNCFPHLRFMA